MNNNYGKSNNFDFDLGIGSTRPKTLNDQKNPSSSYSSYSSIQSKPATSSSSWQPNKPTWTYQPAPNQTNRPGLTTPPTSMVGDIFGKSWNTATPAAGSTSAIGIVGKNPNLFGDLVGSALGQGKNNSNAPLKSAAPVSTPGTAKSAYSMGNMADSLPKTNNSVKSSGNWGSSSEGFGSFTSAYGSSDNNIKKGTNLGGPSIRSMGGSGSPSNKDPFGSLVDFRSKQSGNLNGASTTSKTSTGGGDAFGDFQNASKSSTPAFQSNAFPTTMNSSFMGSTSVSDSKMDDFTGYASQNQPPVQTSGVDPLDMLFSSSSGSAGASKGFGTQQFSELDDWGVNSEFEGGNDSGGPTTTELEGLPPPPPGITASSAKNKGMDNYKQGQYPDAIKWLSWAVILLEKAGDDGANMEVLSSRASCYKEVGEYKKAVADCTKVLDHDGKNINVLVQRALLYESMEKYRLGAEDLRTVLKIDPGNRIARSTIHRLNKLAD